jgi:hypothetical protein
MSNREIVYGGPGEQKRYFEKRFVSASIDDNGHILAGCSDCGQQVVFGVDHNGKFASVNGSKIEVATDHVSCAACLEPIVLPSTPEALAFLRSGRRHRVSF